MPSFWCRDVTHDHSGYRYHYWGMAQTIRLASRLRFIRLIDLIWIILASWLLSPTLIARKITWLINFSLSYEWVVYGHAI